MRDDTWLVSRHRITALSQSEAKPARCDSHAQRDPLKAVLVFSSMLRLQGTGPHAGSVPSRFCEHLSQSQAQAQSQRQDESMLRVPIIGEQFSPAVPSGAPAPC